MPQSYDHYRIKNWPEVLKNPTALDAKIMADIEGHNKETKLWFEQHVGQEFADTIAKRMAELNIEEDETTPVPHKDGFSYFTKYTKGQDYGVIWRFTESRDDAHIVFDPNQRVKDIKADFYDYSVVLSPDGSKIILCEDTVGSEFYTLRILDIASGEFDADVLEGVELSGSVVWSNDMAKPTYYYIECDRYHRPTKLKRHHVGTDAAQDEVLYENNNRGWVGAGIGKTTSGKFILFNIGDHTSNEMLLFDAHDSNAPALPGPAAAPNLTYDVTDAGSEQLFILTNAHGATDFQIMTCDVKDWELVVNWQPYFATQAGRLITDIDATEGYLIVDVIENCEEGLLIHNLADQRTRPLDISHLKAELGDPIVDFGGGSLPRFESQLLRVSISSMRHPPKVYDVQLGGDEPVWELKRDLAPKMPADFNADDYVVEQHFATAHDGVKIPLSVLRRKDQPAGAQPCLLYGYGSYGIAMDAAFSSTSIIMADHGFSYAIAHIRGGTEMGYQWYLDGKMEKKTNTFKDFISCGDYLAEQGITEAGKIVAMGGSAGGLLMGAVTNMRPDLFGGVVALVPFVDLLHTMLNADLPLTPNEYNEWGNPAESDEVYQRLQSFSPIDNVSAQAYPNMYIEGGLTDFRVTFWEPLIWANLLQENNQADSAVLLQINTGSGHFGASGRYGRYAQHANRLAFAMKSVDG